jgi:cytochrome c oxidase subunit 3
MQIQLNLKNNFKLSAEQHPFHLVNPSPWPIFVAIFLLSTIFFLIGFFHEEFIHSCLFFQNIYFFSIFIFFISIIAWFNDIILESTFEGHHTIRVQKGLRYGIGLFIISEVFFFLAFFWAFFHSSISPSIFIGNIWPPFGINTLQTWNLPFLNTLILLSSGVSVTWAHRAIIGHETADCYYRAHSLYGLLVTIIYGIIFTCIQRYEYIHADFDFADSIYSTTFYSTTGLHGLHVLVGTIFLIVCFIRHLKYHFTYEHHFGLEAAIWYWHFVDVVWLFLFISIYWWGA